MLIARFLVLPRADQRLFSLAAVLLVGVSVGLRWLPQPIVSRLLRRSDTTGAYPLGVPQSARRFIRAVESAGRHLPGCDNCLVQAIAVHVWLRHHGEASDLRIGVSNGSHGQLTAHAWVESRGEIVTGNRRDLSDYRVLQQLTARAR